jgi:tetratricopeptide (TPR) repeat protein
VLNRIPPYQTAHFANHVGLRQEILDFAATGRSAQPRIAVLAGPSGIGKTALALTTANDLDDQDIRLYVKLDTDPEAPGAAGEILKHLLTDLGLPPEAVPDRVAARARAFRALTEGRSVLLIIDGASTAAQVRALLPADGLVLVTEARPLSLSARLFTLPPLGADAARTLLAPPEDVEPDLVAKIIELAQGLPLVLRVAAALLARPDRPTFAEDDILTTAYRTLDDPARRCYRVLALPGTTAETSLAALTAALPGTDIRAAMNNLITARLVDEPTPGRYRTSELIRHHARTVESPELDAATRLRDHYFTRAAAAYRSTGRWPQAEPWFTSPPATESVDIAWLDAERDNIRAAIEQAFAAGQHELVATWCVLLWPYYEHGKHTADLLATHQLGSTTTNQALRCLLRTRIGFGHLFDGDTEAAVAACRAAVQLATEPRLEATALEGLGLALLADNRDARPALRRNLELARQLREPRRIALACLHDAKVEIPETALPLLAEAEPILADDPVNLAKIQLWRARKLLDQGEFDQAREAVAAALRTPRPFDRAEALHTRGDLFAALGRPEAARADHAQARALFAEW